MARGSAPVCERPDDLPGETRILRAWGRRADWVGHPGPVLLLPSRDARLLHQRRSAVQVLRVTRPPRKPRSVKVEDDLWAAALARADQRGEVLSEEIRKFLQRYAKRA